MLILLWGLMILGRFMDFGKSALCFFFLVAKVELCLGANIAIFSRPDHCDGGFDQFCDSKRHYSNISLILIDAGRKDLLEYMGVYWKDIRGDDLNLWIHEWNKHGRRCAFQRLCSSLH